MNDLIPFEKTIKQTTETRPIASKRWAATLWWQIASQAYENTSGLFIISPLNALQAYEARCLDIVHQVGLPDLASHFNVIEYHASSSDIFTFPTWELSLPYALHKSTYAGHKYSALSLRSSPYPNFLRTVQVVSCLPLWMKSVCRNKKPGQRNQRKSGTPGIKKHKFNCLYYRHCASKHFIHFLTNLFLF